MSKRRSGTLLRLARRRPKRESLPIVLLRFNGVPDALTECVRLQMSFDSRRSERPLFLEEFLKIIALSGAAALSLSLAYGQGLPKPTIQVPT